MFKNEAYPGLRLDKNSEPDIIRVEGNDYFVRYYKANDDLVADLIRVYDGQDFGVNTKPSLSPRLPGKDLAIIEGLSNPISRSALSVDLINIANNSKNKENKALAAIILDKIRAADVDFPTYVSDLKQFGGKNDGVYDFASRTIIIHSRLKPDRLETVLLHEAIHAITLGALNDQTSYYFNEIAILLEIAKKRIGHKDKYKHALVDEKEFVAYLMTDPEFREDLEHIPYSSGQTLFDRFIELLFKLFNVTPESVAAAGISSTLKAIDDTVQINSLKRSLFDPAIFKQERYNYIKPSYLKSEERKYNGDKIRANNLVRNDVTNKYEGNNKIYDSVTGDVIPSMQSKGTLQDERSAGTKRADRLWGDRPADLKLKTKEADVPVDKKTFTALYDERYERTIAKGQIFHKMVHYHFTKDTATQSEISALMAANDISKGEFEWVDSNTINKLIHRTGSDYVSINYDNGDVKFVLNRSAKDRISSEVTIANDILNMAGTIDLSIDHGNDLYSYFDIKTGAGFNRLWETDLFQFGNGPSEDIFVNPRNKAKLQLMLYAVITKINNPKAKFRNLELIHIPNYNLIDTIDFRSKINVNNYLYMIQNFLKAKMPAQYAELEKLEHFERIFDPATYNSVDARDVRIDDPNSAPGNELKLKILRLQSLILWDKNIESEVLKGYKKSRKVYNEIQTLMSEIITLRGDKSINYAAWDTDLSWMDNWVGTASASTNPYVQLYYKLLQDHKQEANEKYLTWRSKFESLTKALMRDAGIPEWKTGIGSLVGGIDSDELFGFAIKSEKVGDVVKNRYVTEKDAEWNKLSDTQKKFMNFTLDSVDQFFVDEKSQWVDPKTGKKVALANRVVTERKVGGKNVGITNLDLARGSGRVSADLFEENGGTYFRGFMPKYPPTITDIRKEHGIMSKEFMQFLWNKYTTNYYEAFYDGWFSTDEAIPMKYLGGGEIDLNANYTLDVPLMLDNFVKQHYYKESMDAMYTFGLGMKMYLSTADKKDMFQQTASWFEDSINQHVLGHRQSKIDFTRRAFRKKDTDNFKQFNVVKFLRSLKTFFSGPTMWLKPISGAANATFAYLTSLKESVKNQFGIQGQHTKFGFNDLRQGFAEARKLYGGDAMTGKWSENKAFQLMEKMRFLPDSYDWYTNPNQLLTAKNKLFSTRTMFMFHTLPEEMIATATFVAQLKAMKVPDGTSVWDHYVPVTKIDSNGIETTTYEWDGTVRGTINTSNLSDRPAYQDLKDLTTEEINSIKFLYEKMHGGYRLDERTRAEYYIFGELMMQFKKYFPSILKNIGASRGERDTQGYFKKMTDENGKEILQWTPQVIEGRFRLLAGMLLNFLSIRSNAFFKNGKKGSSTLGWFKLQYNEAYAWDNLSEVQKDDFRDFLITSLAFAMMSIGLVSAFDWDEDDSLRKLFKRIRDDFGGNVWAPEIAYNLTNVSKPVAVNKAYKFATSLSETFWSGIMYSAGYSEEALTNQGNLHG